MGQFEAGKWAVGISFYFFGMFLVIFSIVNAMSALDIDNTIRFNDPGFGATTSVNFSNVTSEASLTDTIGIDGVTNSFKFITGIKSNDVSIGLPGGMQWIFSFLFFWMPLVMLLYSFYMMLPFLH